MLNWESTDNFGNLSVAASDANSLEQLAAELASMIDVVFMRTPSGVSFSIDFEYNEINAPDPNQVTHILSVPMMASLVAELSRDGAADALARTILAALATAERDATVAIS